MLTLLRSDYASLKQRSGRFSHAVMLMLCFGFLGAAALTPATAFAQNAGTSPALNKAVQGQSAGTAEGTLLNVVNWFGNVICPIGAGLAVAATIFLWRGGRGWMPNAITAGGLLAVSGLTRLLEGMITNGQSGVQ